MILPRGTTLYRCPPRGCDPLTVSGNGECGPGLYTSLSARIAEHYPLRDMLTLETTRDLVLLDRDTDEGERTYQATGMHGYDGIHYNRFGDDEIVLASADALQVAP